MDTELARTFLAVVTAGNFSGAADRLHVTQSTVSARIRTLEESLGCSVFVRNKAGTTLTPAGRQFQKHATTLVRTLEQARQEVGIQSSFRAMLTVGGRIGLWERLLLDWLPWMRDNAPDISLRAEIGYDDELMQRLIEGSIDVGVMYTPQSRPGLTVEALVNEELVLVSTRAGAQGPGDPDYVYVDWGPEFFYKHSMHFADRGATAVVVGVGWLGLQHILGAGGAGYFPQRIVQALIDAGQLTRVPDAPTFVLPAYVVYPTDSDPELLDLALRGLRQVVAGQAT
jgi:DNA-binding transcriptional LysR family regulator